MTDPVRLIIVKNPFDRRERDERMIAVSAAPTLEALVGEYLPAGTPDGTELVISVNGEVVPREHWAQRTINTGDEMVAMPVVRGGGGGGILGTVLSIALMVVAPMVAPAIYAAMGGTLVMANAAFMISAIGIGVSLLGSALIGALMAPDKPNLPAAQSLQSYDNSPSYRWNPATTQEPGGIVNRAYGRVKLYGNIIAGYIENSGDTGSKQVAHALIDLGMGPYSRLYEHKINQQDVANYTSVTLSERIGQINQSVIGDFPDTRITRTIGAKVVNGSPVVRDVVGTNFDALEVVITFPSGLYYSNDSGGLSSISVTVSVEYSSNNGGTWTAFNSSPEIISGAQTQPIRRTFKSSQITRGANYSVRVTNQTADQTSSRYGDDMYFTEIREVLYDDFTYPRTVLVGINALATDQLSGGLTFECMADAAIVRVWNGNAWVSAFSRNPAWIAWDILTQPVLDNSHNVVRYDGLDPSRLVLADFFAWAQWCDENVPGPSGMEPRCQFDAIFDTPTSCWEAALEVAASARATLLMRGTSVTVVWDRARTLPVQVFSVGNTAVGSFREVFLPMQDRASAIEVDYVNADQDHQRDKLTVVNANVTEASAQRVQFSNRGIRRPSQAWREAMVKLKRNELLRRTAELGVDIDAIACTPGDLVWVQDDVTRWGEGGRIVSGTITDLQLDKSVTLEPGKTYEVVLRTADDSILTHKINNLPGTTSSIQVQGLINPGPQPYDVWAIGETGRAVKPFIVSDIRRDGEQRATLSLIEYNESLYLVDSGAATVPTPDVSIKSIAAITNLTLTEGMMRAADGSIIVYIDVDFDMSAGCYAGRVAHNDWPVEDVITGHRRLMGAVSGQTYKITVIPIDHLRRVVPSRADAWITVVGKLAPPADVPWLFASGKTLSWGSVSDVDLAGYRLRWAVGSSAEWFNATPMHTGLVTDSPWESPVYTSGTATIMVKAVDTSGNESLTPAILVVNLGDPIVHNVIEATDLHATSFPGTFTGASISGGDLLANTTSAIWNPDSSAPFWTSDADDMWDLTYYQAMTYIANITVGVAGQMTIDRDISGEGWSLDYRTDITNALLWSTDSEAMWADDAALFRVNSPSWQTWPGAINAEPGVYQIRVRSGFGRTRGRIDALAVSIDVPDIVEYLNDIAIGAGGTRLPITKTYHVIRAVNLTLQDNAGAARTARVMDKLVTGPLINTFDSAHTATTGNVDAIIQGY